MIDNVKRVVAGDMLTSGALSGFLVDGGAGAVARASSGNSSSRSCWTLVDVAEVVADRARGQCPPSKMNQLSSQPLVVVFSESGRATMFPNCAYPEKYKSVTMKRDSEERSVTRQLLDVGEAWIDGDTGISS